MRRQCRIIPEYLSTPHWRAKTEKRDGWTIAQAQWAIQDTQSRDPNWTTEEWKKRGAAITTAEAKKGHTQHTKNSSLVTCQDDPSWT